MSAIIRPRSTRFGQPPGPVEVDWSNPLAKNLAVFITPMGCGCPIDLVSGTVAQRIGTPIIESGPHGRAASSYVTGNAWWFDFGKPVTAVTDSLTTVVDGFVRNNDTTQKRAYNMRGAAFVALMDFSLGGQGVVRVTENGTTTTGANILGSYQPGDFAIAYSRLRGSNTWLASLGGTTVMPTVTASGTSNLPEPITNIVITNSYPTTNLNMQGGVYCLALIREFASQEVLNALTANPWQLLKPIQHRVWIDVGGAVSDDRTGQAHISHASATTAAGVKATSATVSISHTHALTATGVKQESAAGEGQAHIAHSHSLNIVGTKATTGQAAISHAHSLTVTGYKTEQETDARTGTAHIFHAADLFAAGYKATTGAAHILHMHSLMVVGVGPIVPIADDEIYMTTRLDARNYTDRIQARDYTARLGARIDTVRM